MLCIICGKDSSELRSGCCSKDCSWEFLLRYPISISRLDPKTKSMNVYRRSEELKKNTPQSELWFWKKYEESRLNDIDDMKNTPLLGAYIPDVLNYRLKYVIEVDGFYHSTRSQKKNDKLKDDFYKRNGFKVFRVRAYSDNAFIVFKTLMLSYRRQLST